MHLETVLTEHAAIADGSYQTERSRSHEAAAAAMKVHLDRLFETIRTLLIEKRHYFTSASLEKLDGYTFEISGKRGRSKAVDEQARC